MIEDRDKATITKPGTRPVDSEPTPLERLRELSAAKRKPAAKRPRRRANA